MLDDMNPTWTHKIVMKKEIFLLAKWVVKHLDLTVNSTNTDGHVNSNVHNEKF